MSSHADSNYHRGFKGGNIFLSLGRDGVSPYGSFIIRGFWFQEVGISVCAGRDSFPFKQSAMSVRSKLGPFGCVLSFSNQRESLVNSQKIQYDIYMHCSHHNSLLCSFQIYFLSIVSFKKKKKII